jgi:hypothetical protein
MTQRRLLLVLALLATVAWTSSALGYWYGGAPSGSTPDPAFNSCWGTSADGQMDTYPTEGYHSGSDGWARFTKSYHHFAYMAFDWESDGPDKQRVQWPDTDDGVLLKDWMEGKKVIAVGLYFRVATNTCNPDAPGVDQLNVPVSILGFRVSNQGDFNDRGIDEDGNVLSGGYTGCCASYNAPLVDRGMNAPPAWRMGRKWKVWAGDPPTTGYNLSGDIGNGQYGGTGDPVAEYYKVSTFSSAHQGETVEVSKTWFSKDGLFQGGFSTSPPGLSGSGRWAFDWLVEKDDAHLVNSSSITNADCLLVNGFFVEEPRDAANDGPFGGGWYHKAIDPALVYAMAHKEQTEVKGLVFSSVTSTVDPALNTVYMTRDQSGGRDGPYLWVWKGTVMGDCALPLDSCNDVADLLAMATVWGTKPVSTAQQKECDLNYDKAVDISDLLALALYYGKCVPAP